MKGPTFKRSLGSIQSSRCGGDYDTAFREVEALLKSVPGNSRLHVLRAELIQLQDDPTASLDDAKRSLEDAIAFDDSSPAAAIELGHFLDAVEDDPKSASKVYSKAIAQARSLLIEALLGQARALLQLDKQDEAVHCVAELVRLSKDAPVTKRGKAAGAPGIIVRSSDGQVSMLDMEGPYAGQIQDLIKEVAATNGAKTANCR